MIKLKKISAKNFWSFGNSPTEIDLDKSGSVLIMGENLDVGDQGTSRNGVGKTGIFQAIIYALYGKGIDKEVKADEFINEINEKGMEVELELSIGETNYRIKRTRKPNSVEFYRNDESLTRDGMRNTDEMIASVLGMPYEVFMGVFFLSPHKTSFMAMGTAEQRSFIENVLSLDILAKRAEKLKEIRKEYQAEIRVAKREVEIAVDSNESTRERIKQAQAQSADWEAKNKEKIDSLQAIIDEAKSVDTEAALAAITSLEEAESKLAKVEESIASIENEIRLIDQDLTKYNSEITRYTDAEKSFSEHESKAQDKLDGIQEKLNGLTHQDSDVLAKKLKAAVAVHDRISELLKTVGDIESDAEKINANAEQLLSDIENKQEQVDTLRGGKCPYCKQSHVDKDKVLELDAAIEDAQQKVEDAVSEVESKMQEIEELNSTISTLQNSDEFVSRAEIRNLENEMDELKRLEAQFETALDQLEQPNPYAKAMEYIEEIGGIEKARSMVESLETDKAIASRRMKELAVEKEKASDDVNVIEKSLEYKTREDVKEITDIIKDTESKIAAVKESENPHTGTVVALESSLVEVEHLEQKLASLEKYEEHCGYLIKLLTDPRSFVRKNIVDQYVPFLNKKLNSYISDLGSSHVAEINSDLTVDISNMGRKTGYYNMSQGERLRLNMATTMAFKDLMAMLGKNCNVMMVDELIDSAMDPSGVMRAVKFIQTMADHILFISHREEVADLFDRTMLVSKKDGFTTIGG